MFLLEVILYVLFVVIGIFVMFSYELSLVNKMGCFIFMIFVVIFYVKGFVIGFIVLIIVMVSIKFF